MNTTMLRLLAFISMTVCAFGCLNEKKELKSYSCPCSKIGLDSLWADNNHVSCFLIPVPKNSKEPDSGNYYLAAAVAKSISETTESPLLYLHGGPGIATLGNLPSYLKSTTWKLFREQHDMVFFDYRGTGFSEPSLCNDLEDSLKKFSKINPTTIEKTAYELSLYKNCKEKLLREGTNLVSFSSFQLASDAEVIRKTLKIPIWNIYGVSYGTTVALNLLRSYPASIKSVMLDSPFPPNAPWLDFVRPFDTCFKVLEKNIATDPLASKSFPSIRKDFVTAVKRLNSKPALLNYKEKNGKLSTYNYTGDDFAWSIWSAMLKTKSIPYVPLAIQEISNGNDSVLQLWSDAFSSSDSYGKFSEQQSKAILCFEGKPQTKEDHEESLRLNYPDFISFNSGFATAICNVWRPEIPDKKIFEPVVSNIPVLILCGEYDPVCPPYFGAITAQTLSNSTLLIVPSASHAAIHADDCIRSIAKGFIMNPKTKPLTKCALSRIKIDFITSNLPEVLKK